MVNLILQGKVLRKSLPLPVNVPWCRKKFLYDGDISLRFKSEKGVSDGDVFAVGGELERILTGY